MKKCTFQRCLRAVDSMTSAQRHELKATIEHRDKKDLVAEVVSLVGTPTACPHCHHSEIRSWGHAAGLPRFRCLGCKRTFNALTNTPLSGLHHKDRWLFFLEKFSEGESVRKAAWRCGINTKAAFLWRHRFLALPACLKARQESGIVETDETWFLRSYKGQRGGLPRRARKRGGRAAKRGLSREQGSGSGGPGSLGSDFRCDSSEGRPLGDRSGAQTSLGSGCGPLFRRRRKGTHRSGGPRYGRGPSCGESQQGDQSIGRGLPHPERERLPFAAQRMDETIPRGGHKVSGPLLGLASHDRDIWRASQLHSVVDFIRRPL